jgi:nicotinate-nucleotide adenylyltransferase
MSATSTPPRPRAPALALDEVLFVPSHVPPHRATDPHATPFHRFAMVALATAGETAYRASDIELRRSGASYTYETLAALHAAGWRPRSFSSSSAPTPSQKSRSGDRWAAWSRARTSPSWGARARRSSRRSTARHRSARGCGRSTPRENLRPSTGVYLIEAATRNVSSTTIRTALQAGRSIADLVPDVVERHIIRHGLYGAVARLHGNT